MALLDRVKQRIETDLDDTELEALITEATAEIERRFGPAGPVVLSFRRHRSIVIDLVRPADTSKTITIVEDGTELSADDFELANGGRTLRRVRGWGRKVEVTYTPVDDSAQRDEVVIELVQLAVEYRGVASRSVGDVNTTYADISEQRERILARLEPRPWMAA